MPEGPAGRGVEALRARARASACHAESIDGAEPSGSIEPVMAGRHAPAYDFATTSHRSQAARGYEDVVFESLENVESVGSGKMYRAFSDEELRDFRDTPASGL